MSSMLSGFRVVGRGKGTRVLLFHHFRVESLELHVTLLTDGMIRLYQATPLSKAGVDVEREVEQAVFLPEV